VLLKTEAVPTTRKLYKAWLLKTKIDWQSATQHTIH